MYPIVSRRRQSMIGFSIFCCLWLVAPKSQALHITHADSDLEVTTIDELFSDINQPTNQTPLDASNNQEISVAILDSGLGIDEYDINQSSIQSHSNLINNSSSLYTPRSNFVLEEVDPSTYPRWENQAEIDGDVGVDDDENGFIDDLYGWDWIDNDHIMNDQLGHGTSVSTALVNLVEQINGDRNVVKLMPLRIVPSDGKGKVSDLVDALAYAMHQGVQIVNLNLFSYHNSPRLAAAIETAHTEGMLMITSAVHLNDQTDWPFPAAYPETSSIYWPAAYSETLSVLGVYKDSDMNHCLVEPHIDVAVIIESGEVEHPNHLAVPYTTAIIALALAQNPELSLEDIRDAVGAASNCENGSQNGIRPLEIEALAASLQSPIPLEPTALEEANEPITHQLYLPLIAR